MEDDVVLCVNQLVTNKSSETPGSSLDGENGEEAGEHVPLIQSVECRICQEEDSVKNCEIPCACSGSLKFAHRKCVQRWCNEKGDTICEICHKAYEPGYMAPPQSDGTVVDISASWTLNGTPINLLDPRLVAMAAAERNLLDAEYEDTSANGASFCRSAALILMALLLLRHALTIGDDDDDDASAFFALFMLRAAGLLFTFYMMAWAISILKRLRQSQEPTRRAGLEAAVDVDWQQPLMRHP
uniref:uncharacterized protein LOC122607304 isoform X2 n=1 Tax=Erigeron canadensis TaxID=72917 RepID=UPI001CB983E4|nr:uncharacterized protein LOC122607304 isoform X2 [Erigeron canadensis]